MENLYRAIAVNLSLICYGSLMYMMLRVAVAVIDIEFARRMDNRFQIVLNFIWAWIGLIAIDLFFVWVTR